jgi:hypothetical protein
MDCKELQNFVHFQRIYRNVLPLAEAQQMDRANKRWIERYPQQSTDGSLAYRWTVLMGKFFADGSSFVVHNQLPSTVTAVHTKAVIAVATKKKAKLVQNAPRSLNAGIMAGPGDNPVQVFATLPDLHWEFLRLWTGFELPSSWSALPCYGLNLNRNILDFMRWPQIDLGAQDLNGFNGQNHFKQIAGSKVLDEYYNSYLRK